MKIQDDLWIKYGTLKYIRWHEQLIILKIW
jgi:hypothetical protein